MKNFVNRKPKYPLKKQAKKIKKAMQKPGLHKVSLKKPILKNAKKPVLKKPIPSRKLVSPKKISFSKNLKQKNAIPKQKKQLKPQKRSAMKLLRKQVPSKKAVKPKQIFKAKPKPLKLPVEKGKKTLVFKKKPAAPRKLKAEVEEIPESPVQKKPVLHIPIDEVVSFLNYEISPELKKLIIILEEKAVLSETEISEKMSIKINGARKLLYILRDWGFADYEKKSDENKSWWFIYFWSLNREKILNRYIFSIQNEIRKRETLIKAESDYSFSCSQ